MKKYDIIVVGAGHAGCEAALAAARLNKKTIVFATNLDTVAFLACNPSIGGTAKGQIVKEIDALGGQMAKNADSSLLQMRMLNLGKGPAVHSPRAQVDKFLYHQNMKATLETQPNLTLRQGEVVSIEKVQNCHENSQNCFENTQNRPEKCKNEQIQQKNHFLVTTSVGQKYCAEAVILCCGVYLNSRTIVGENVEDVGPNGFKNAKKLTQSLVEMGFEIKRFKTGTPARVKLSSLHLTEMSEQKGQADLPPFSFVNSEIDGAKRSCFLTYTTPQTKQIILQNKHQAPIFSGGIDGVGPRYCPSIEDKVVRFFDKERHQIFLEPEGEFTSEFYVQGASSSMPADIQEQIYKSIDGLKDVEIMRDAYAIEYDCIDATTLDATLSAKNTKGLYFAGQINGTSGYEEAACQGLVAGINAVRYLEDLQPFILTRNDSYIGVLIDDITTKHSNEPYRMMTSRAEHRLVLRQDNADLRLTQLGREIGLVDDERYGIFCEKLSQLKQAEQHLTQIVSPKKLVELFAEIGQELPATGLSVADLLRRNVSAKQIQRHLGVFLGVSDQVLQQLELNTRYQGYIEKQQQLIDNAKRLEGKKLPPDIDYNAIEGLRIEARQKLSKIRPLNLGQAGRISGVSPADIQILIVYLASASSKPEK